MFRTIVKGLSFIAALALTTGFIHFFAMGTAGATPVVSSYTSMYTDEQWANEHGFASLVVHRDVDGTLSVQGEKLGGESVAIAINVSIDGGPFVLAQTQPGVASTRVDPDWDTWLEGSKLTVRNGENARFEIVYTPAADAQSIKYNVTIAGAEQAEGGWLYSLHEPAPGVVEL